MAVLDIPGGTTVTNTKMVEPEFEMGARRCKAITNVKNFVRMERNLAPYAKWSVLYKHCKLDKEDTFEFEYDSEEEQKANPTVTASGDVRYTREELRAFSVPDLRKISIPLGINGTSKEKIIKAIRRAQGSTDPEDQN